MDQKERFESEMAAALEAIGRKARVRAGLIALRPDYDTGSILAHHRLAWLAVERGAKFRHV